MGCGPVKAITTELTVRLTEAFDPVSIIKFQEM